ncbi:MAG TPA: TspO/MBR family protein [Candidatus Chromulinivoraceae bacterium]|nr:TspO/MBR family protein [Candidatus Chromulinivoraceae bacterium]
MSKINKLLISVIISLSAGVIGSLATVSAIPTWYSHLEKPLLNPPNWVFGPVWTALYILMGVSLYLVWTAVGKKKAKQQAYLAFAVQLLLNVLWSVMFFGLRNLWGGALVIVLLFVALAVTMILFRAFSRTAFWLLVPYIAWICFATYLNVSIAVLN